MKGKVKRKPIYQLAVNEEARTADINIYGAITSMAEIYQNYGLSEGEVSAHGLKGVIDSLDVDTINVYINSMGGEVSEALAICSALKRHQATVHTFCDGFACSAASVIFCVGDQRTMSPTSMLMIHNCMSYLGYANSGEMRKAAEDNDKINSRSIEVYKAASNLEEEKIVKMMDAETWLTPEECLEYGLATDIDDEDDEDDEENPQQSAMQAIRRAIVSGRTHEETEDRIINGLLGALRQSMQEMKEQMLAEVREAGKPVKEEADQGGGEPKNRIRGFFGLIAGEE